MTMSRGLMRVLLAAVAWAGVLVTYGATQSVINASVPIPDCNCLTWSECDPQGGWKCVSEKDLCAPKVVPGKCGGSNNCTGYCEKDDIE